MNITEKAVLAALTDISGIGDARAHQLYNYFDNLEELLDPSNSLVNEFHYIDTDTYTEIQSLDEKIEAYRHRFDTYRADGISILSIEDQQYPDRVRNGPAPVLLYAKGNLEILDRTAIGVSGSRETNETGQEWIHSLSSNLAAEEYIIVSGGAQGADTAAHEGALESAASTIAVLGTGVNVAYPPENEPLFERIVDTDGLLISMRPPNADPTRHSFLSRNELIAALSDGMVFVATDGTGGTMAQYETALEQNRPVFVPPKDLSIEPSNGLPTLRDAADTHTVQTPAEIPDALSTPHSPQKNLDEWT